jgi:hypothetical protein
VAAFCHHIDALAIFTTRYFMYIEAKTPMTEMKLLLFVSKSSLYFQEGIDEFQKAVDVLSKNMKLEYTLLDVNDDLEEFVKHKVPAVPALYYGDASLIGEMKSAEIIEFIQSCKQ